METNFNSSLIKNKNGFIIIIKLKKYFLIKY